MDVVVDKEGGDGGISQPAKGMLTVTAEVLLADSRWLASDAILPMAPKKPSDADHDHDANHRIELVEILSQLSPILAKLHPQPS